MFLSKIFPIISLIRSNFKLISLTDAVLIYGAFFVLPNTTEQKRINNLSEDSRKALEILTDEVKAEFDKLFLACSTSDEKTVQASIKIVKLDGPLLAALRKLENILQMLPAHSTFQAPLFISDLIKILKDNKDTPHEAALKTLEALDKEWENKNELSFEKFEKLEEKLRKIHHVYGISLYPLLDSEEKQSKISQWWIGNKAFLFKFAEFIIFYLILNTALSVLIWIAK